MAPETPRRGRTTIGAAALLTAALLVAAGVWLTWRGASDRSLERPERRADASEGAGAPDLAVAEVASTAAREHVASSTPQDLEVLDAVAALDAAAMRLLARRGKARYVGLVLAPDGAPCPGARLFVDGVDVARSDARGAYDIELRFDTIERSMELMARAEDVGSVAWELEPPSRRIDLQLARGATVRGRAIEQRSGRAVAGAEVELLLGLAGRDRGGYRVVTRTAADGAFRVDHVPPSTHVALRALADEFDSGTGEELADLLDGEERVVELSMRRRVAVRVRFAPWPPRGAPAGETAQLHATGERELTATVDAAGGFELRLAEGSDWQLSLEAGSCRLWHGSVSVPLDSPPLDLGRIDLVEPSTIVGRVDVPPELASFDAKLRGDYVSGEEGCVFEAPLADDGSFEIGPFAMTSCSFGLVVGAGEKLRLLDEAISIEPGQRLDLGSLALKEPLAIGRVVDEAGGPITGMELDCALVGFGNAITQLSSCVLDEQGRFAVDIGAFEGEQAHLVACVPGLPPLRSQFLVRPGVIVVGDLVLRASAAGDPALRKLRGRLVASDGTPFVGAKVVLNPFTADARLDVTMCDGSFEFLALERREYQPVLDACACSDFVPPPIGPDETEVTWIVPSR